MRFGLPSKFIGLAFLVAVSLAPVRSFAIAIEVGSSYAYKKSTFDADNKTEQQSTTASLSLYFWERVAVELSYTNGLFVKKEKQPNYNLAFLRTTTVYSNIYGADLILILSGRESAIQPFIKGGAAQINRRQVVQDENANPWEIKYAGTSPNYGVGLKIKMGENLSLKISYDMMQTPVDNSTKIEETTGRVGLAWMF